MEAEDYRIDPRMRKQEVERKRRLRIASSLEKLKEIVQQGTGIDNRKADKVEILESTVKFLKEKQRTEHEESFCSGYNSCLVEISGQLMAATDIDFKSKSLLLTFISKLSSAKQIHLTSTKQGFRREEMNLPRPQIELCEKDRQPLTNIQNVNMNKANTEKQKGMKRSRSEPIEKENIKKVRVEKHQENITASTELIKERLEQQQQPPNNIPGKYSLETTNIAVIQKNSDGKFTEISKIPLKSLLKNLQVLNKKDNKKERGKPVYTPTNNQEISKHLSSQSREVESSNTCFSYMKLLQEESIDPEFLRSSTSSNRMNNNFETTPLHSTHNGISLPPLSVFLNEQSKN